MITPVSIGLPAKFTQFRSYPGFSQWETASQIAGSDYRFIGVCAPPGTGKCHSAGTEVIMFDGSLRKVENVLAGEYLMGPDSNPRQVIDVCSGRGPLLEIVPVKGNPWKVTQNHILTLVNSPDKDNPGGEIIDISVADYMQLSSWKKHHLKLFRVAVTFQEQYEKEKDWFFDPYTLGIFIGDGSIKYTSWVVTKPDPEIAESLTVFAESRGLGIRFNADRDRINIVSKIPGGFNRGAKSTVRVALEKLGLFGCGSGNKFIPSEYKTSTRENRFQVLAGLLDTDGHLSGSCFDYISKSRQLAEDVVFVSRSLGLSAYLRECIKGCQNGFSGTYFRVSISGDTHLIPTRIERKKAQPRRQKKNVLRTGFSVRDGGEGEWVGFSVDGDSRYLLNDFTVTHNSILNMTASRILDSTRTLYLTVNKPLQSQLVNDFSDCDLNLFNINGHSSYSCTQKLYDDGGDLSSIECSEGRDSCDYWRDVEILKTRSHVCSNYANWISIAKYGDADRFGKFDLLILDEAHNLESLLCDQLAVKFSARTIHELLEQRMPEVTQSLEVWIDWAERCLYIAEDNLAESRRNDKIQSHGESLYTKRLKRLVESLGEISSIKDGDEWVIEPTSTGVQLTPVSAAVYAERYLFRGIEKVILSSATLTVQDLKYLGLASTDYEMIDIESGFDANRRPFIYWPTQPIDYSTMQVEGYIRQVMNRYDKIIDIRGDRKGITHSISYKFADLIAHYSRHPVVTHQSKNAQQVIGRFMASQDPGMLVSPIIHEGLDFADDKARFQFIWKVPTLDARHPLIAARKKRDKKYVLYRAGKTILQMYGRLPRSTRDWGECVVLDKHWGRWMRDAIPWPRYFRAAWKEVHDAPEPINF